MLFTLIAALLIVGVTDVLMDSVLHAHRTLGIELGIEVVIVLVGVTIPAGLAFAALWPELKTMLDVTSKAPPKSAPILLRIVSEELKQLEERITDARSRGTRVGRSDVTPWIRKRCFAAASGAYLATDLLVPSEFLSRYRSYLEAHAEYVGRTAGNDSVRVNLAPTSELAADMRKNPKSWDEYVNWHEDNGVELLHLDRATALDIARETEMGKTIDFAIWEGELVILVDDLDDGDTMLSLAFVDDHLYRCCETFLRSTRERAKPFDKLPLSSPSWTTQFKSAIRRRGRNWRGQPVRRA